MTLNQAIKELKNHDFITFTITNKYNYNLNQLRVYTKGKKYELGQFCGIDNKLNTHKDFYLLIDILNDLGYTEL